MVTAFAILAMFIHKVKQFVHKNIQFPQIWGITPTRQLKSERCWSELSENIHNRTVWCPYGSVGFFHTKNTATVIGVFQGFSYWMQGITNLPITLYVNSVCWHEFSPAEKCFGTSIPDTDLFSTLVADKRIFTTRWFLYPNNAVYEAVWMHRTNGSRLTRYETQD